MKHNSLDCKEIAVHSDNQKMSTIKAEKEESKVKVENFNK